MKTLLSKKFFLASLALFILAASSFIPTPWYLPELFSHFQLQYFVIGTLVLIALFFVRPRFPLSFVFITAALTLNLINLYPYMDFSRLIPGRDIHPPVVENRETYSLLQSNLFKFNFDYATFIDMVRNADPDIVMVFEMTPGWSDALQELTEIWPHYSVLPERGSHGIGLFSKYPLADLTIFEMSDEDIPALQTKLRLNGRNVMLWGMHPRPPVNQAFYNNRNQHLQWLADNYGDYADMPVIIVGDFNTTMFSPHYKRMIHKTGLINAREKRGIQKSWYIYGIRPLGIPIDHFMHNDRIAVTYSNITPDIRSDHRPLLTYFKILKDD